MSASVDAKAKAVLRVLQGCDSQRKLRKIQGVVVTAGLHRRFPAISSALLRFSAVSAAGCLSHARLLFRHQTPDPTAADWNSLIRGLSLSPYPLRAISYYNRMVSASSDESRPDTYTFSFVLRACDRARSPEKCREVHGSLVRRGFEGDVLVGTNLLRSYSGNGLVGFAGKVFDEMPVRDLVAWNAMVSCYSQAGLHRDALGTYGRMRGENVGPDGFTIVAVLSSCAHAGALSVGVEAHRTAREKGFLRSVYVGNALIDMYAKCGSLNSALGVFDGMRKRDVFTWNSMIVGYGVHGRGDKAVEFFERMVMARIEPKSVTFLGLLCGCSHQGLVDKGVEYFNLMTSKYRIEPGIKHYGCLVDLFGRAGKLDKAMEIIEACPAQKDPVLWRTLLGSCKIHRNVEVGETAMTNLVRLGASNAGDCVLLAAIYQGVNNADGVARMRKMIKSRGIKTTPGWSWIEVDNQVHKFVVDDKSHCESDEIYKKLGEVVRELGLVGYVEEESLGFEDKACSYHSEKLAIAFGLLRTREGTCLRIVKNLRVCKDCHYFTKFVSKTFNREIVVRDRLRFHHFKGGLCSCKDYW